MFSGYAVGGILAAVLGKGLIVAYGWQSVFVAAGLPIVIIPFILKLMPESMPFLVRKNRVPELKAIVARLKPGHRPEPGDRYATASRGRAEGARIAPPLRGGPRVQHGDVLGRVLHVPVHGLRPQLLAREADGRAPATASARR